MTHEFSQFTGVTFNDLTHPEPKFQGHRSFSSSIPQKSQSAYFMNRDSGDRQDNSLQK